MPLHPPARSRTLPARILCAAVGMAIVATTPAGAATRTATASKPSSEERQIRALQTERAQVRARKAKSASRVDALKATDAEIHDALADLSNHVSSTSARLEDAQRAADAADAQVAAATAAESDAATK